MQAEQSSHPKDIYQIIVSGHLDFKWKDWFDGFDISHQANNETLMVGPVADQAALHGLLNRIRDLGMTLITVQRLDERRVKMETGAGDSA